MRAAWLDNVGPLGAADFLGEMSAEMPHVHLLGSLNRHITVYSQQTRAINLIDALAKSYDGKLRGRRIAVVGAGFAGLTAAAYAASRLLLEALSQTYGSLAGNWRDARDYAQARAKYDAGNTAEEERRTRCRHLDSYNLLQRLVVRLLEEPKDLERDEAIVDGRSLEAALAAARSVIAGQVEAGRQDSWALADLALVTILCGESAEATLASLDKRHIDHSFYESTHKAVSALIDEGLGGETELRERLIGFRDFLERKGGLRTARTS